MMPHKPYKYYNVYLNSNDEFVVLERYSDDVKKLDITHTFVFKQIAESEDVAIIGAINTLKMLGDVDLLKRIGINYPELVL